MGLVLIPIAGLYLLISTAVVLGAIVYARNSGKSKHRWGWGAAIAMYLVMFWDHVSTVVTHEYYCGKESGFWTYKTLAQWQAENPGVLETLVENKSAPSFRQGDMENFTDTYQLNQRIQRVVRKRGPFWGHLWRWEQDVVDGKTGEILGRYVDLSAGNGNVGGPPTTLKFWLQIDHCNLEVTHSDHLFYVFENSFIGRKQTR